jgi:outer membrane receptor protein involved in Fe transport
MMTRQGKLKAIFMAVLFLVSLDFAWSQAVTGSISGSVTDTTGAAVQGAELKLMSETTGAERSLRTGQSGEFVIDSLDPGGYSLSVAASGFKTLERKGIRLTPSERLPLGVLTLELGAVGQQITVTEQGATVQTASAEYSSPITTAQTEELPVYGRTVTSLVSIAPGVVDPIGAPSRTLAGGNATDFNVAGNRTTANNFTVDGITLTAVGGAPNGTFGVSMEAISEIKVLISNYQAEYGRLAGSDVEMITKSGTKTFHGMAMYYMRNEALNANNYFNNLDNIKRPVNRFNAFTYNIGGPVPVPSKFGVLHDKLFFFWNQENLPQHVTGALQYSTMPTALERAGNFSQSYVGGKLATIIDPSTGAPFPGNIIPAARLDANGVALLNVLPLPNATGSSPGAYNYASEFVMKEPLLLTTLRLDYNLSPNDSLSGTFTGDWETINGPNGAGVTAPFAIVNNITRSDGRMVAGHYTRIFSPTAVNELTVGYAETYGPTSYTPSQLGTIQRSTYGFNAGQLNPASNPLNLLPGLTFGGVTDAPSVSWDGRFPYNLTRYVTDIGDNFSKGIGAHTFKAGVFVERMRQFDGPWATDFNGAFDFSTNANNSLNTGDPFANAALGVFNSYTEATSRPTSLITSTGVDWFVQDNWRVTKRLTLDYGIRFGWYQPFHNYNNEMAGFVSSLYNPSQAVQLIRPALVDGKSVGVNPITGQTYSSALVGFIAPNSGNLTNGMLVTAQNPSYPRALVNNMGPLVGPRFGFAYDPYGDGKTAIRGGVGLFYNRPLGTDSSAVYSYPLVQTPVVQFGTLSNFTSAQGFISPPSVIEWQRNLKAPRIINMSLSVQRNIGFGTVLNVGYVGSLGNRLSWQENLEPIPLGAQFNPANANPANPKVPLPSAFLVPLQGYSAIALNADEATSNYHSLQVTANRRFARDVQFGLAWTWSKTMDWTDSDFGAVNNAVPANLFRAWNYGLAGFDRTQVANINWMWDVPRWNSAFAPAKVVVNGWHIYGITTFSSGGPLPVSFNQVTATNITGSPSVSARIDVTGNIHQVAGLGSLQAFNPNAFALPAVGTLGDPAKVLVRGPGINNWNTSLVKSIPISEHVNTQFRAELYNTFNHTQYSSINTTALFNASGAQVNSQFGQYTAAQNPRIIQLALRVQF